MKLLKVIRKFERFNFHGVPEGPELSFERNRHSQFTERPTGKSLNSTASEIDYDNAVVVGYIKDDFENRKETFIKASSPTQ